VTNNNGMNTNGNGVTNNNGMNTNGNGVTNNNGLNTNGNGVTNNNGMNTIGNGVSNNNGMNTNGNIGTGITTNPGTGSTAPINGNGGSSSNLVAAILGSVFGILGVLALGLLLYCCWPNCFEPVALLDTDRYALQEPVVEVQEVEVVQPPPLQLPAPRPVFWRPISWQNGYRGKNFVTDYSIVDY